MYSLVVSPDVYWVSVYNTFYNYICIEARIKSNQFCFDVSYFSLILQWERADLEINDHVWLMSLTYFHSANVPTGTSFFFNSLQTLLINTNKKHHFPFHYNCTVFCMSVEWRTIRGRVVFVWSRFCFAF